VLQIEREVATSIAHALDLRLPVQTAMAARSPRTFRAYELFLKGQERHRQMDVGSLRQALDLYRAAIEEDPGFARPHLGVAEIEFALTSMGSPASDRGLERARAAVERALEIDPTLAAAHTALGMLRSEQYDWAGAERAHQRALELEPGNALVQFAYALFLKWVGRVEEAMPHLLRAVELDPLAPDLQQQLGVLHLDMGDEQRGIAQLRKALELDSDFPGTRLMLAHALAGVGRADEALEVLLKEQGSHADRAALRTAFQESGIRGSLRSWLDLEVARTADPCTDVPRTAASRWAWLGETDQAFVCLERAVAQGQAIDLQADWMLASLRSDPRFAQALRMARLSE
jgi:serine/threonine-protein kinase